MAEKTIKSWEPNATQKSFLETLKDYPYGMTLKDIELNTGVAYKTGAINILVSKGLVVASDGEFQVDLVYRNTKIGSVKKSWKIYKLAEQVDAPAEQVDAPAEQVDEPAE